MNTRVDYMYRDGANYKIHLSEVIKGEVSQAEIDELDNSVYLDMFYPAKVGFCADTFVSNGYEPYDDDPDSHEIVDFIPVDLAPTVDMTAEEFVLALKAGACVRKE